MEHKENRTLSREYKSRRNETTKKLQESSSSKRDAHNEVCQKIENRVSPVTGDLNKGQRSDAENKVKKKKKRKIKMYLKPEYVPRTICLSNIPQSVKKDTIRRMCMAYGVVEAVNVKAAPIFDPSLPRTYHSYVRFSDREDAQRALSLNGRLCKNNHLRAMMASDVDKINAANTIFVGNIPYGVQEKEVWELFENIGPVGSVCLRRDKDEGTCMGYGHVTFKNPASAELSLVRQNHLYLHDKQLRISRCNAKEA